MGTIHGARLVLRKLPASQIGSPAAQWHQTAFRIIDMQILIYAKFAEKSYRRFLFLSHNRP
ncbi:hypothetical protein CWO84_00955 [Methylomonas sp. Kb3]|nr:hypothetical protein CWO84_00955 [Methylomonas sp. Kb3]